MARSSFAWMASRSSAEALSRPPVNFLSMPIRKKERTAETPAQQMKIMIVTPYLTSEERDLEPRI